MLVRFISLVCCMRLRREILMLLMSIDLLKLRNYLVSVSPFAPICNCPFQLNV